MAPSKKRSSLVGSWRLACLEEPGADGRMRRSDCSGLLVLTNDGRISVHIMYWETPPGSDTDPVQYAQNGYIASYGVYEIDERARTLTHRVDGALVRSLIGRRLSRTYELRGDQLILRPTDPAEHWTITWERC